MNATQMSRIRIHQDVLAAQLISYLMNNSSANMSSRDLFNCELSNTQS